LGRTAAQILEAERKTSGPVFCHPSGLVIRSSDLDFEFHTQLQLFQEHRPNLIPANIDIRVDYSVYRSLRRGSTSREGELGVPDPIVDLRRGDCTPYRQVWCGKCYTPHHTLKFFVENPENEFGAVWEKKEDMNRFVCGRSGDSLTFPFQCDTCSTDPSPFVRSRLPLFSTAMNKFLT